jgi:hypothetical protein
MAALYSVALLAEQYAALQLSFLCWPFFEWLCARANPRIRNMLTRGA